MRVPALLAASLLVACGGGGDDAGSTSPDSAPGIDSALVDATTADSILVPGDADTPDAPPLVDASPDAVTPVDAAPDAPAVTPDAPATSCSIAESLGTVSPHSPSISQEAGPPRVLHYVDPLDADPDLFKLVLFANRGVFPGDIAPGTYSLTGAETAYATCGACVEIFTNVDASNNFAAFYLAQSGSITITSVSPRLTGSLSNVTLRHLNDDDTANADGCTTHIASLPFDIAAP